MTTTTRRPARTTRRTARVGVAALATLALAACSTGGDTDSSGSTPTTGSESSSSAAAAAPAPPETWPLTGLPVADGGSASRTRPVVIVKMDNTASSSPQLGLGEADLVVEELVEGGLTRLAAMYYSKVPELAGPVRSMRASDIGIVKPAGASVVTSGAASVTISRIRAAGIRYYNEGSKGFFRQSGRYAPYNLFTHLRETVSLTRGKEQRPADYLPWGSADALPGGRPATSVVARFGAGHSTEWSYQDGHYVNLNSFAADDDQFVPDTVLALRVRIGDAGYTDPAGNPVPETELTGSGEGEIFHGGRRVRVRWTKDGVDSPITLTKNGQPVAVPAGHTWVELVPESTGSVTFER